MKKKSKLYKKSFLLNREKLKTIEISMDESIYKTFFAKKLIWMERRGT